MKTQAALVVELEARGVDRAVEAGDRQLDVVFTHAGDSVFAVRGSSAGTATVRRVPENSRLSPRAQPVAAATSLASKFSTLSPNQRPSSLRCTGLPQPAKNHAPHRTSPRLRIRRRRAERWQKLEICSGFRVEVSIASNRNDTYLQMPTFLRKTGLVAEFPPRGSLRILRSASGSNGSRGCSRNRRAGGCLLWHRSLLACCAR